MFASFSLSLFNHLLASSPWAIARLLPYAGRSAQFDIPPFSLCFFVANDGTVLPSTTDAANPTPDVVIRLPAQTPFLLLSGLDKLMSEAIVSGNAEFATELSFVMRNLRWDAEEDLAKLIGDIPAHRFLSASKGFIAFHQELPLKFAQNLADYFTTETRSLAKHRELLLLSDAIARLDADLQGLEARAVSLHSLPHAVMPTPTSR